MPLVMETNRSDKRSDVEVEIDASIRQRLDSCSYSHVFSKVQWSYRSGWLTLNGRVPSFYLKQTLQELLRGIDQVDQIVNDVDVVSSTGLSSESHVESVVG